jgi:hypothetical protein
MFIEIRNTSMKKFKRIQNTLLQNYAFALTRKNVSNISTDHRGAL